MKKCYLQHCDSKLHLHLEKEKKKDYSNHKFLNQITSKKITKTQEDGTDE
jgi:hypothetical protein